LRVPTEDAKLKIKVLYTGGTIGTQDSSNKVLSVRKSTPPNLIGLYENERRDSEIQFDSELKSTVLSENIALDYWESIYNAVKEVNEKEFDGIIITHGTDTIAYTAVFLSMMLQPAKLPILLVSSDYPLDDPRSNGLENFTAAVDFIKQAKTKGVFVPFCKSIYIQEIGKIITRKIIHLGSRLQQAQPFVHNFSSLGNISYGRITASGFERNEHDFNPTPNEIERTPPIQIPAFPRERKIVYLKAYPGIDYSIINFKEKPDAIIHGLYHSGTACASPSDRKNSIVEFARQCIEQGIDFYAAPFDDRQKMYASSNIMQKTGVQFIKNVSPVAAYVKLVIAYGSFYDKDKAERKKFIESNIACEQFIKNETDK
jgi:L-asparaginase